MAVRGALLDHFCKVTGVEFAAVGAAENPAARGEAGVSELDEPVVVFLHAEHFTFVVAGKGGGVEDDTVEGAVLSGKTFEPVEGVTFAKVMVSGVELIYAEVVFCPVEVNLGEVERGRGGPSVCGTDGKCTGVSKGIEHGLSGG